MINTSLSISNLPFEFKNTLVLGKSFVTEKVHYFVPGKLTQNIGTCPKLTIGNNLIILKENWTEITEILCNSNIHLIW